MDAVASGTLGERVAELRRRRGLSQKDLATEVGKSESWVSQVERDVLPVERVSVLQLLADALGVSVRDLRPEAAADGSTVTGDAPDELETLRLAMTGHPALSTLLGTVDAHSRDLQELRTDVEEAWRLSHASQYSALASLLVPLLADLEGSARTRSRPAAYGGCAAAHHCLPGRRSHLCQAGRGRRFLASRRPSNPVC